MKYRCPKCQSDDLRIDVSIICKLDQSESKPITTHLKGSELYWDEDSDTFCNGCNHLAPSSHFEIK